MENAKERLAQAVKEAEEIVYSYLPAEEGHQKTIFEAMNYSVKAGGKRLRPILMREVYRLFGGQGKEIEPLMAAIEMIHTSSLIHDDLPCMDNDEYRRGKKTTWVAYGYDMAVLAGDALLIYAIETAAKAFAMTPDAAKVGRCIQILSEKTGIYGMIGGQTVDVELTNQPIPKDKLDFIYRLKTGALLEASIVIGAVMAGPLSRIPMIGSDLVGTLLRTKNSIKQLLIPGMWFENMGITYLGPVDGHDIKGLIRIFSEAKKINRAVLIHVITKKGKGYRPAEKNPSAFHGVEPFDIETGKPLRKKEHPGYTDVFSREICRLAAENPKIVAVTAAMPDGTGLKRFSKEYPDRFFDVGIAEEHAVTSAAGMAAAGLKPVVAVYSSFLQRAYDQVIHDVCIQNLPVVFCVDRAGLVGSDGETHQGIFDLTFLSSVPNMSVMAPKNRWELEKMLQFAISYDGPIAIRYPRGEAYRGLKEFLAPVEYGVSEMLYEERGTALLAVGSMVSTAEHIREKLKSAGQPCTLVNGRFVKPMDTDVIDHLAGTHHTIVTLEENVLRGGYGERVTDYVQKHYPQIKVVNIALPDAYVEHGNVSVLRNELGIDSDSILAQLKREGVLETDAEA